MKILLFLIIMKIPSQVRTHPHRMSHTQYLSPSQDPAGSKSNATHGAGIITITILNIITIVIASIIFMIILLFLIITKILVAKSGPTHTQCHTPNTCHRVRIQLGASLMRHMEQSLKRDETPLLFQTIDFTFKFSFRI